MEHKKHNNTASQGIHNYITPKITVMFKSLPSQQYACQIYYVLIQQHC